MRFESWYFLFLAALIPLLHFWWIKQNRRPSLRFSHSFPKSVSSKNPTLFLVLIRYCAVVLLIVALARPQEGVVSKERKVSGVEIMLVMDVSMSMKIEDIEGRNRLDAAKDTIKDFVLSRKNDRIGFSLFSGEAFTMVPLTLDYGLLLAAIDSTDVGRLKDGTAIGDGLALAVNRMRSSTSPSKVIVLLTDGDNNVGQIDPLTAGEIARGFGVRVHTIAFGREGPARLPIEVTDVFGRKRKHYQHFDNALNPELLIKIAEMTGGKFFRAVEEGALAAVYKEIDQLEKSESETKERIDYNDRFFIFLIFGFGFILFEVFLRLFVWRFAL
jgi:Ca-activated chloride channel family protein